MLLPVLLLGLAPGTPLLPVPIAATPPIAALPAEASVQAELLPAETRFVAHVDVRAILTSQIWLELAAGQLQAELEGSEELDQMKTQLGLDPLLDIHSITVFGSSPDEDSAAVLVRGTKALENALRRVEGMDGHTRVEVEGLAIHVFDQGGENTYIYAHDTGRSDEGLVVLSASRIELLRAALVLRGSRDSLAALSAQGGAAGGLDLKAPPGTLLHVAFSGEIPGLEGNDPVSGVLRMARGGVFSLGESRGELALHLGIVTESEEAAFEMADAVDGLKALGNMLLQNMEDVPPDARRLLRSFRVNNDGSTVFVDFAFPLAEVFQLAREHDLGR